MKTCSKCGEKKGKAQFYRHPGTKDGLNNKCKECARNSARESRWKNIEKVRAYDRKRSKLPHRQKAAIDRFKKYRTLLPLRHKAHSLLASAIKCGRYKKPSECEVCGKNKPLDGHHDDYSRPLGVVWLCKPCHKKYHVGVCAESDKIRERIKEINNDKKRKAKEAKRIKKNVY